jgi:acyl carrier protein
MRAEQAVRKAIGELLVLEPMTINLDSKLDSDLGMDSLDLVDVVCQIENEFGIEISDADADALLEGDPTVQHVINFIENRLTPVS